MAVAMVIGVFSRLCRCVKGKLLFNRRLLVITLICVLLIYLNQMFKADFFARTITTKHPSKQGQAMRGESQLNSNLNRLGKYRRSNRSNSQYACDNQDWVKSFNSVCSGNFVGFSGQFALLRNFVIHPEKIKDLSGGLNMSSIMNQAENKEYLEATNSCFEISCNVHDFKYSFQLGDKNHLNKWIQVTQPLAGKLNFSRFDVNNDFIILVMRYEYVNLYHTMTDIYSAYKVMSFLGKSPDETTIMFFDAHPAGGLDKTWSTLFKKFIRVKSLKKATAFTNLAWNTMGYNSQLNQHGLPALPCVEEFSNFYPQRHGVPVQNTPPECQKLRLLFIWRRDYIAHPRNPSGHVSRKIKNEDQLINVTKNAFPGYSISAIDAEKLDMHHQLLWIRKTDILIGMHGAGLSHVLFLPKSSAVIEIYPTYYSSSNIHFKTFAKWRGLNYFSWQNQDEANEFANQYTYIPPNVLVDYIQKAEQKICTT